MRFTVLWDPVVENDLANFWLDPVYRAEIREASDYFDRELRHEADVRGMPYGRERLLTHGRFAATFRVSMDDRIARITQVWLIRSN